MLGSNERSKRRSKQVIRTTAAAVSAHTWRGRVSEDAVGLSMATTAPTVPPPTEPAKEPVKPLEQLEDDDEFEEFDAEGASAQACELV